MEQGREPVETYYLRKCNNIFLAQAAGSLTCHLSSSQQPGCNARRDKRHPPWNRLSICMVLHCTLKVTTSTRLEGCHVRHVQPNAQANHPW